MYEYEYPYEAGWHPVDPFSTGHANFYVACPTWGQYWARTTDSPSEFRLVSAGNLEMPTTWSIKRDTVGDIYRTHPYISQNVRVVNRQGIRLSFAYKETGKVRDPDSGSPDYYILPLSLTVNMTLPAIQALSSYQRNQFIGRAMGAFIGAAQNESGADLYSDFALRWAGDLRPHHFRDVIE